MANRERECHRCKHAGADPDGPYCGHPKSFEKTMFGCGFQRMHDEGLCTNDAKELFEAK